MRFFWLLMFATVDKAIAVHPRPQLPTGRLPIAHGPL
jgi:hypothetical protein